MQNYLLFLNAATLFQTARPHTLTPLLFVLYFQPFEVARNPNQNRRLLAVQIAFWDGMYYRWAGGWKMWLLRCVQGFRDFPTTFSAVRPRRAHAPKKLFVPPTTQFFEASACPAKRGACLQKICSPRPPVRPGVGLGRRGSVRSSVRVGLARPSTCRWTWGWPWGQRREQRPPCPIEVHKR